VRANAARALSRQGKFGVDVLFAAADGKDRYARDAALAALAMVQLEKSDQVHFEKITISIKEQVAAAEVPFGTPFIPPPPPTLGGPRA
jgi:hypothetical protein